MKRRSVLKSLLGYLSFGLLPKEQFFMGTVSDVRCFDRVLSAAERRAIYAGHEDFSLGIWIRIP